MTADRYFMTSAEAASALRVTPATLYAYTSRGLLHSEAIPGRPRERRYSRDEVARLRERQEARRDPAKAAARGLHWGGPVLESGITLIHDGEFYYRGRNASAFAETATLEEAATVLWAADASEIDRLFDQMAALSAAQLSRLRACAGDSLTMLQAALPIAARNDVASFNLRPEAVRQSGARIVRLLTLAITMASSTAPVHRMLQRVWAPKRPAVAEVIRTALVLCADHELNVSAFTARCAASAGASPYDVVAAAMATLKGYKHGGAADRVLALAAESDTPKRAHEALARQLRRGESIPGFGHRLYPAGDPRARLLLRLAASNGNEAAWRPFRNLLKTGAGLLQDHPNLDLGLAAITRTYRLPEQAPFLLFALGRTTGWIAHAIEEYASGQLIRPRARYTGPPPTNTRDSAGR